MLPCVFGFLGVVLCAEELRSYITGDGRCVLQLECRKLSVRSHVLGVSDGCHERLYLRGTAAAGPRLGRIMPGTNQLSTGTSQGIAGLYGRGSTRERDARERCSLRSREPGYRCIISHEALHLHSLVTDAELRDAAVLKLKQTTVGYRKNNGQPSLLRGPRTRPTGNQRLIT